MCTLSQEKKSMVNRTFGSGSFGEWIEDEFGLPAYHYTCDQRSDSRAFTPVNPIWRAPTDHSHQVGNDRLVAVASNYGYVQLRQDEGGPKFLNDYDPKRGTYAGGFGYLTDGHTILSTYYTGAAASFERIFGIGYLRKTVSQNGLSADQVIFAPFGDDPILISQVTIRNQREVPADLRWVEYWGCQVYQFSHRSQVIATISRGKRNAADLRRELAQRFSNHTLILDDGSGLLNQKKFLGYRFKDRLAWSLDQFLLSTVAKKTTGGALKPPVKEAWLEDLDPPPAFLVSLDALADGFATDEPAFFGQGGVDHPDGLAGPLNFDFPNSARQAALLLERRFHLDPGESRTLVFAYGYLPESVTLKPLLDKYRRDLPGIWAKSSAAWKTERIQMNVPSEPWVARELTWHNYYLRSNLTYDSFFREHILSQGHVYQYIIGFQGAARDPLQHALPFIYSRPKIVKEVLRYTLKEVLPDGEIPYGVTGSGMRMAVPFRPSDQELWLLWLASEYILATRDSAFLDETLPTFPLYGPKAGRETVRNLLARCFHHLTQVTGTGCHGLLRISNGDWNDGAVVGFVPKEQHEEVRKVGESVLNAAFAVYALDLYSQMLACIGDHRLAGEAKSWADEQRKAVGEQWTGSWFRRGWLNEKLGWIGEKEMWLEPQPWAIIGGSAAPKQVEELVDSIDKLLRKPSPIGAMLLSRSLPQIEAAPGDLTNGGVWPSINGTLIWALALVNGSLAWEEWKKNSLAFHAEAYPDVWYGIWSGPDTYNSVLSKYAGQTFFDEKILQGVSPETPFFSGANWTDFPVMNMHPHAWPLYDTTKLIGLRFTPNGFELAPCLPLDAYKFDSPLLGLEKTADGWSGWYAPTRPGMWRVYLRLLESSRQRFTRLEVNGKELELEFSADGNLNFIGESTLNQPLRWSLQ
jgi:hypothetical protein